MKVKDILAKKSPGVITIAPELTLHAASQLLAQHNIGALVVVGPDNLPIGILSERDIVRTIAQNGPEALEQLVGQTMTVEIITALPYDELSTLSATMTAKRIRHLPILQEHVLIGIVSIGDVVKAQLVYFESEAQALENYITGRRA